MDEKSENVKQKIGVEDFKNSEEEEEKEQEQEQEQEHEEEEEEEEMSIEQQSKENRWVLLAALCLCWFFDLFFLVLSFFFFPPIISYLIEHILKEHSRPYIQNF